MFCQRSHSSLAGWLSRDWMPSGAHPRVAPLCPFTGTIGEHLNLQDLLELSTQLMCVHTPHCISLWKPPFKTTASREGSLSAQEECSSCNKKRGCLGTCTPKKKLDLLLKCNPFTPQPADGSGIVQNRPLPLLWGGTFFFQAQEPTEPQGSDHREASSPD